jgi:SAM-dependent methyltransferase
MMRVSAPHPLAERLIERLQPESKNRILDFAAGSGRNTEALRRAGFTVIAVDDGEAASAAALAKLTGTFAATISTHGLLHGTLAAIKGRLRSIADHLVPGGLLCATFGSTRDARFGRGERLGDWTFAPLDGDERGVPHSYYDRVQLRTLLERDFVIESLDERGVDDAAGTWAHRLLPMRDAVHWFAIARRQ